MTLLTILLMFTLKLTAPPAGTMTILESESIRPYEAILGACIQIESSGDRFAYNPKEQSAGILQITPVMIQQYFKETGIQYTKNDCYDIDISKEIFLHMVSKYDYRDIKGMAVAWNGKSIFNKYYAKIQKQLLSLY